MTWRRILAATLILLAVGAGVVYAINELTETEENESRGGLGQPSRLTVKDGVSILTLSETDRRNSGIETAHPSPAPEHNSVAGYGTVLDAAPLTELNNQYLEAEAQAQTAAARLTVTKAALDRARVLNKDQQNISTAQLQTAEGLFEADKAASAAAKARLATVVASAEQAWGEVIAKALINHQPLLDRLIGRRDYLVKVTLPPGTTVAPPAESATARLQRGEEIGLALVSPAPTADPKLQRIGYFYRVAAEDGLLPGLNLQVVLVGGSEPDAVVVPESAVVWLQGAAWIYLRTDASTFIRREIVPKQSGPSGGYLVTSLPPESEIVVRGAQMLLSEEFRAQVPVED